MWGAGRVNDLAKRLLAEKRINDFYEDALRENAGFEGDELAERLKEYTPVDERQLLLLWEAQYAEDYGREPRRFVDFVAQIILDFSVEDEGRLE